MAASNKSTAFKSPQEELNELQNQLSQIKRESGRTRLNTIVAPEIFLRPDGTIDHSAREKHIKYLLDTGYGQSKDFDSISDSNMIEAYSNILADYDRQRQEQRQQEDQQRAERLHAQISEESAMRDNQQYSYIRSPQHRAKAF